MSKKLEKLRESILADGVIDSEEVDQIRTVLYEDGVIDRIEAEWLFGLNDAVSGKENCPGWADFFVEAISSHLLSDENSPGTIDPEEEKWLLTMIEKDGKCDEVEGALLRNLMSEVVSMSTSLKNKIEKLLLAK